MSDHNLHDDSPNQDWQGGPMPQAERWSDFLRWKAREEAQLEENEVDDGDLGSPRLRASGSVDLADAHYADWKRRLDEGKVQFGDGETSEPEGLGDGDRAIT